MDTKKEMNNNALLRLWEIKRFSLWIWTWVAYFKVLESHHSKNALYETYVRRSDDYVWLLKYFEYFSSLNNSDINMNNRILLSCKRNMNLIVLTTRVFLFSLSLSLSLAAFSNTRCLFTRLNPKYFLFYMTYPTKLFRTHCHNYSNTRRHTCRSYVRKPGCCMMTGCLTWIMFSGLNRIFFYLGF